MECGERTRTVDPLRERRLAQQIQALPLVTGERLQPGDDEQRACRTRETPRERGCIRGASRCRPPER